MNGKIMSEENEKVIKVTPEETEKSINTNQESATFLVIGDKAYTSEIIEEYNRNAEAKTEAFNTNAENKTASYNSNAADRTTAFNNNYDDKMATFNSNANTQKEEFDSHVLIQTNTFNKNAASKLQEYNDNATQKIEEYDLHSEELDNKIIATRNELERVKNDVLETGIDSDTFVHLEDSAMAEYQELSIDGVCEQETTSGKNFLHMDNDIGEITQNGITVSVETSAVIFNGTSTVESESTESYKKIFNFNKSFALPAGDYTLSAKIINGSFYFTGSSRITGIKLLFSANDRVIYQQSGSTNFSVKSFTVADNNYIRGIEISTIGKLTFNNLKLGIQIEEGLIATDYEPYTGGQPSPSPEYPQEIKTIEKRLPSEYQEVEYIESTGTQYIDTKYIPNINTRFKSHFEMSDINGLFVNIFGSRIANTHQFHCIIYRNNSVSCRYGTINISKTITTIGVHNVDFNKKIFTFDNEIADFSQYTETIDSKLNAYLFAVNDSGHASQNSKFKLYNAYIYDNDILVRDFIPCYRKSDNEIGLYDLVNNEFYTNQGTGTFLKGEDKDLIITSDNGSVENYLYSQIVANLPEGEFIGKINDTYKDSLKVEYNEEDGQYHLMLYKNINREDMTNCSIIPGDIKIGIQQYKVTLSNCRDTLANGVSTHFKHYNGNGYIYNHVIYCFSSTIYFTSNQYTTLNTLNDFLLNEKKAGRTPFIYYILKTPYVLDLGVVDMPITYNEITNLFTDSDLMPTINAKYYRNFISTIQNLQVNEKALKEELVEKEEKITALNTDLNNYKQDSEWKLVETITRTENEDINMFSSSGLNAKEVIIDIVQPASDTIDFGAFCVLANVTNVRETLDGGLGINKGGHYIVHFTACDDGILLENSYYTGTGTVNRNNRCNNHQKYIVTNNRWIREDKRIDFVGFTYWKNYPSVGATMSVYVKKA